MCLDSDVFQPRESATTKLTHYPNLYSGLKVASSHCSGIAPISETSQHSSGTLLFWRRRAAAPLRGVGELVRTLTRLGSFECLFGLDREAERNFRRPVENLKEMIAEQATELALGAANGIQFNAAVAGIAFWTDYVGPSHRAYMPPTAGRCKPVAPWLGVSESDSAGLIKLRGYLFV